MNKFIILILLFSTLCQAQDAIFLDQNKPAPFAGYLLPQEKILEFRNDEIDLGFYKKTNDNLNLEITDYQTRLKNYQEQNDNLAKQLNNDNFFSKSGYFVLGCIITGLVAQSIYRTR